MLTKDLFISYKEMLLPNSRTFTGMSRYKINAEPKRITNSQYRNFNKVHRSSQKTSHKKWSPTIFELLWGIQKNSSPNMRRKSSPTLFQFFYGPLSKKLRSRFAPKPSVNKRMVLQKSRTKLEPADVETVFDADNFYQTRHFYQHMLDSLLRDCCVDYKRNFRRADKFLNGDHRCCSLLIWSNNLYI